MFFLSSFRPLSNFFLSSPSPCLSSLNWPQPQYACLGFKTGDKSNSDVRGNILFHLCLFSVSVSTTSWIQLKYHHKKQEEAAWLLLSAFSMSYYAQLSVLMCTINLSEKRHRRSVQHWECRSRVSQLRSLWTANTAATDKTTWSCTILHPIRCRAWQNVQICLPITV